MLTIMVYSLQSCATNVNSWARRAGKKQEDEKGRQFHKAEGEGKAGKSDEAGKADVRPALHAVN